MEIADNMSVDLFLLLVHIARSQLTKNPWAIEDIILHWFPFLALSWVHDDDMIRSEGALWATEIAQAVPAEMRGLILDGLAHIIFGKTQRERGKADLSKGIRRNMILSEPFRGLFNWASTHRPREWKGNSVSPGGESLPAYNYDLMKDMARRVADLPADYFDMNPQVRIETHRLSQNLPPSPSLHSPSTPLDTRKQTYPLVPPLETHLAGQTPPLMV